MRCKLNEANEEVIAMSVAEKAKLRGAFSILKEAAFHVTSNAYSEAADAIKQLLGEAVAPEPAEAVTDGE